MTQTADDINSTGTSRLVTIAIPTFNRANFLRQAIESARAQTYSAIEIVVSDNASTDDTSLLLASYQDNRLRHVRQLSNIGMVANWNACLSLARGEYFLLLSDDDRLAPNAIQDLIDGFCDKQPGNSEWKSKDIAFVYGRCEITNTVTNRTSLSRAAPLTESSAIYRIGFLRSQRVNYPSATLLRVSDLRRIGGYSSQYGPSTDVGASFAISGQYDRVACVDELVAHYLFHPANMTSSIPLDATVESMRALAREAVMRLNEANQDKFRETQRAGDWACAATFTRMTGDLFFRRSIGLVDLFGRLWRNRNLFKGIDCIGLPLKLALKIFLLTISGRRPNFSKLP
jgi:glycosyltransferase involved in cell wall biosynthesis